MKLQTEINIYKKEGTPICTGETTGEVYQRVASKNRQMTQSAHNNNMKKEV